MPHPEPIVQNVGERIGADLDRILGYFREGAKIAVVVWRDDLPEQDFVMASAPISEAGEAIARRIADPATATGHDL